MNISVQDTKEKAMMLAAQKSIGLHRLGKNIVGVDKDKTYWLVVESDSFEDLWSLALQNLEQSLIKELSSEKLSKLKVENIIEKRDKLRFEAINMGIKNGWTIFHRGNKLIGLSSSGEEKVLFQLNEDISDEDRPSDEIWSKAISFFEKDKDNVV